MSLSELIAGVERHEQTLTVVNADPAVVDTLRERFADRNVDVEAEHTVSGRPDEFVTLSQDGRVQTATSLANLQDRLDAAAEPVGIAESPYRPILDHLDETTFTAWSIGQLLAASREIEDRAWRVGAGTLHAGFQTTATLTGERERYDRLAETAVDVHAYAVADGDPPPDAAFTVHVEQAAEIARTWFVVFDGDGEADQKCALLAEEREPRRFYGFWTYDPATVDYVLDHLRSRYGVLEQ